MKFVDQNVELMPTCQTAGSAFGVANRLMAKLESCIRVAYKSDHKQSKDPDAPISEALFSTILNNRHLSVLEHVHIKLYVSKQIGLLVKAYMADTNKQYFMVTPAVADKFVICGNLRAFYELVEDDKWCIPQILATLAKYFPIIFKHHKDYELNEYDVRFLGESEDYYTFRITTNRGVMTQLVRHRDCSFTVESTRYCNYKKLGLTFCNPNFLPIGVDPELNTTKPGYHEWARALSVIEDAYISMINEGCTPEIARSILPNDTACIVILTMPKYYMAHFVELRADAKTAHPDIYQICKMMEKCITLKMQKKW